MNEIKANGYIFIPVDTQEEGKQKLSEIRQEHHDATIIESPYGLRIRYRDWF